MVHVARTPAIQFRAAKASSRKGGLPASRKPGLLRVLPRFSTLRSKFSKAPTVPVEVPAALAAKLKAMVNHVETFRRRAVSKQGRVDFAAAELEISRLVADVEAAMLGDMLASMDPTADRVSFDGKTYVRMAMPTAESYTGLRANIRVERGLYRQEGVRNGPTIVPLELLAGFVEGQYTPAAARVAAALAQETTSRSAEVICQSAGILPHSRSSQQKIGIELGKRWEVLRPEAESELVGSMDLPASIVSAAVAVDRISLPMAEARPMTAADEHKGVKNPINVNYRMAYVGAITMYDADANPVSTIRYAHLPEGGAEAMEESFKRDLLALLVRRPSLRVVTLADGAHEMQSILDRATSGIEVTARFVDFWHLTEHLAHAIGTVHEHVPDLLSDWKDALLRDDEAITKIEAELLTWKAERAGEPCPPALHAAITYIQNHRDRLRYATAKAQGLPIGSGTVEATGKAIVQVRMRRPGSRWKPDGAKAIMGLRAVATSSLQRWDAALDRVLKTYCRDVKPSSRRNSIRRQAQ